MLFNDPSIGELQAVLAGPPNRDFRIQFSEPDTYDAATLAVVNAICDKVGSAVSIRFYDHSSGVVDCAVAASLPACRSLFLDAHQPARNVDAIKSLPALETFGINGFDAKYDEVLSFSSVQNVSTLYIGTNRRLDWDLAQLREFTALKQLSVVGQSRNISAIGELQGLESLWLYSIPRKASLEFISRMPCLKKLTLMLGGREALDGVRHSGIIHFEVIWVKGLLHLDLSLFLAIETLKVEDQARIRGMDVSKNANLQKIHIDNCKTLEELRIDGLTRLVSLYIGGTAIDAAAMLEGPMPTSLTAFDLWGYGRRRDAEIETILRSRGFRSVYREHIH